MASYSSYTLSELSKYWPYRRGYFAVLLAICGVIEVPLLVSTGTGLIISLGIISTTAILLFVIWHISRSPTKTKKGKLGFVVSISCDDEDEAKKIRSDFVLTLQRLIKDGRMGSGIQFIDVANFISEKIIDQDDARRLQIQTKCHFLLYGRVRVREINKIEYHIIELSGLVRHRPISNEVSKIFANEFGELLPGNVAIPTENDLLLFQFTSEWAQVVAEYIIGIAAAFSGALEYAKQLFTDVLGKVNTNTSQHPVFIKLRQRIPIRLFEISEAYAVSYYNRWVATKNPDDIKNMGIMLSEIDYVQYKQSSVLFLMSIYAFIHEKDVAAAQNWLHKCNEKDRNYIWHLNQAFLYAYQGNLKVATRHYRTAIKSKMIAKIIYEIESFVLFVATKEKNKYQLYYCLGFFNLHVKGDTLQATKDLEKFIKSGKETEFMKEKKLARGWVEKIKNTNTK